MIISNHIIIIKTLNILWKHLILLIIHIHIIVVKQIIILHII
jgi:hypothetical protein